MSEFSSISKKHFPTITFRRWLLFYQNAKALIKRFGYVLLIAFSAILGIALQGYLQKIDPFSAIIDSSIWVVVCYTLCSFLIYHLVSLQLTRLLLNIAQAYTATSLRTNTWHGKLYFISAYFLVLYGFLFCLSLWM